MKNYVILTGAGVSAESGIRTFRETGGLWEEHRVEDVASPEAFVANPVEVWNFYKERYKQSLEAKPNPGHFALKKMEDALQDHFYLITQNVDEIHSRAGNKRVYEMHGRLGSCFCTACRTRFNLEKIDLEPQIPECKKCKAPLRPDIVWFGEVPYYLYEIEELLKKCDVFMIVGTSGSVYPAAGFVMTAKLFGAHTIAINLERPENHTFMDEFHMGKAGEILPSLVDDILAKQNG